MKKGPRAMKKLLALLLVLIFLVSCSQEHPGNKLEKFLVERFEEGDRIALVEEMVEPPWDSVWLVDKSSEDMVLPADLEGLAPADYVRVIAIKEGEIQELELPESVEFVYVKGMLISAYQLYNDSEFLIDRLDGKLKLYYQEDCNV